MSAADHEPDIRRLEARRDVPGLVAAALSPERPPALRQAAVQALGQCGGSDAVEPLIRLLDDADTDLRIAAAKALWWVGDRRAVEPLCAALTGERADLGAAAAEALERIGDRRAVDPLCQALALSGPYRQRLAARALGALGDRRAAEPLLGALLNLRHDVREAAIEALDQIAPGWEGSAASQGMLPDILAALRQGAVRILDERAARPLLATFNPAPARPAQPETPEALERLVAHYLDQILRNSKCIDAMRQQHWGDRRPSIVTGSDLNEELNTYFKDAHSAIHELAAILRAQGEMISSSSLQTLAPMGQLQEFSCTWIGDDSWGNETSYIDCTQLAALARAELGRRAGGQ